MFGLLLLCAPALTNALTCSSALRNGHQYCSPRRTTCLVSGIPPPNRPNLPKAIFAANAATKWLVVFAQTSAVFTRRDLVSPWIVIGSINAAFATAALKRLINQERPDGAPFTDPGMPSSHALVATFAAASWAVRLRSTAATTCLSCAAILIGVLRVVTGYHTWAQVGVGGLLGAAMAMAWMALGRACVSNVQRATAYVCVYGMYAFGSVLFIGRKMRSWTGEKSEPM